MPRRAVAKGPAQDPALVVTTMVDFKAESIDGEREAWAALCAELGVEVVEPPASYAHSLRPNVPAAKPRLVAHLPVGNKVAEAMWEKADGQTEEEAERALAGKLRDAVRVLLTSDHRLLRRLRQQRLEEERRELRAAWRTKDLAGLQEKLAADPLWFRLFRPVTVRAQAADIARMGSRLALSMEAGADPAAKPLYADFREKIAALAAKAQALLQPVLDRELKGFLPTDAVVLKELAALQLALLRSVGELAGLAGKPGNEAEADAVGELKASVAKLQAHIENGPPEPASDPPSTASSLRDSSAPPSPTASRDASPSPKARRLTAASPAHAPTTGILKPDKDVEGKGTWVLGLDVDEAEHVRFAAAAEPIKALADRHGVLLQHIRYNAAAIEGAKVGLALTAFPDQALEVAEVMKAIEDAVATPLAPTEAPEHQAVLAVLGRLPGLYTKGKTREDRERVAKALSVGYNPDETPAKVPTKVHWAEDEVNTEETPGASGRPLGARDVGASPAAFLAMDCHSIPPPTPAQPAAAQTISVVAVAGRSGQAVVALLGVSTIAGKVLIDYQSLHKDSFDGWTDDKKKSFKLDDSIAKGTDRAVVLEREREDKFAEAVFAFRVRGLDAERMAQLSRGMAAEAYVGFVVADADHLPPAAELDRTDSTAVRDYLINKLFDGAEWAEVRWARVGYGGVLTDEGPGKKPSIDRLVEPSVWTGADKGEDESFGTTFNSSAASASSTAPSPRPGSPRRRSPATTPQATQPTTSTPALNGTTPDSRADPNHSDATPTRLTF